MKKVCVIGHFGNGKNLLNGQTIKTKIITEGLIKALGEDEVSTIDTHGGAKALPRCFLQLGLSFIKCKNVIMLPAHNGVRIFTPILLFWKALFHRRLHYVVIGGWLPDYLKDKPRLAKQLKKFDGIYVETSTMKKAMEDQGFKNLHILPNCKDLHILSEEELICSNQESYKFCTFSRVLKEKGIEDAILAVKMVNEDAGYTKATLDIYGQIDLGYEEEFNQIMSFVSEYIYYGGLVPFDESTDVLKSYTALLFPTYYAGEGFAGTLIDAMASGTLVIASDWKYNPELVTEGVTGFLYPTRNVERLTDKIKYVMDNPKTVMNMKRNCIREARNYLPENAMRILVEKIED